MQALAVSTCFSPSSVRFQHPFPVNAINVRSSSSLCLSSSRTRTSMSTLIQSSLSSSSLVSEVSVVRKASSDLQAMTKELEHGNHVYRLSKPMESCMDDLFLKKGSAREKALSLLVDGFRNELHHPFLEKNCITLLDRCLNCIKKGSPKEKLLASLTIGLLSIIVGDENNVAHEILEDLISLLSQPFKSGSEITKVASLLDCMAIVTFVGRHDLMEMERSMQFIWEFIQSNSVHNVAPSKPTTQVLASALSAWSYLLATTRGFNINGTIWKGSLSHLSHLLENDEESVRMAAGEAIALIFEMGTLEKFSSKDKSSNDSSYIERLKETILNQVTNLSMGLGDKGSSREKSLFFNVLELLKGDDCPKASIDIGQHVLDISTWSQSIQVNFLKRFLGDGFMKHMEENELLHNYFKFRAMRKQQPLDHEQEALDIFCSEKDVTHFVYIPEPVKSKQVCQRMFKSQNSFVNKGRTKMINKKRDQCQARNSGFWEEEA